MFTWFLLRTETDGLSKKTNRLFDCGDLGTNVFSFLILPKFKSTLTWKICFKLCSEGIGRHSMLKCRMKRGVTGLRPPPGGAHADTIVTSCRGRNPLGLLSKERWELSIPIRAQNQQFLKTYPLPALHYVFLYFMTTFMTTPGDHYIYPILQVKKNQGPGWLSCSRSLS